MLMICTAPTRNRRDIGDLFIARQRPPVPEVIGKRIKIGVTRAENRVQPDLIACLVRDVNDERNVLVAECIREAAHYRRIHGSFIYQEIGYIAL